MLSQCQEQIVQQALVSDALEAQIQLNVEQFEASKHKETVDVTAQVADQGNCVVLAIAQQILILGSKMINKVLIKCLDF